MGGIATDLDGASSLRGLYASGECARSGVHGANRLASNSLLECFVFSRRAVLAGLGGSPAAIDAPRPGRPLTRSPLAELRRRMWRDAGPVRDEHGLTGLLDWLEERPDSNPVAVAHLIASAARARSESRGAHVRSDFSCRESLPRPPPAMPGTALDSLIDRALAEDVGDGDLTTDAIVPAGARGRGAVVVREPGVICGLDRAFEVIQRLDPTAAIEVEIADGGRVQTAPAVAATIEASLRALLTGERTALNLLQRMSGIATATARYVDAIAGTGAELLDTRKTAPGLRALDKQAVACGGGANHRAGLHDAVLIKDNHLQVAGSVADAVAGCARRIRASPSRSRWTRSTSCDEALAAGAETVLLDNMDIDTLRRAVAETAGRARLEASGGITLDTHPSHRRDRRRRHLGGRADALGAGARHRTGGHSISILTDNEIGRLHDEVRALAEERNAVILAHNYQVPEVQDVADYVGDSLGLSQQAAATEADVIVFAGVHFMAETAAILAPDRTVLIPDLEAGCSLAASIDAEALAAWKAENPGAVVVSYVNTTAEVKALSDYCCTSGNARAVIEAVPDDRDILFLPDMFLGAYLERLTGRRMKIWPGECHVHAGIRPEDVTRMMEERPGTDLLIHPECGCASQCMYAASQDAALARTTHVLSTEGMVRHVAALRASATSWSPPRPASSTDCARRRPTSASTRCPSGRCAAT